MNNQLAIRGLWWKEWKQMLPLVALLAAIATLMHALLLLVPDSDSRVVVIGLVVGLPGLFAVGAGALLIGQEKELRTLQWLGTLPVVPKCLIASKLRVALLGLALVWGLSILMLLVFTGGNLSSLDQSIVNIRQGGAVVTWPLHTLYLLLLGVAFAWRFQSSLLSLVLLVPAAMIPTLLATLSGLAVEPSSHILWQFQPPAYLLIGFQVLGCALAYWLGWRWGYRALGPTSPPRISTRTPTTYPVASLGAPYPARAALIWQSCWQNRYHLLGCCSLILFAIVLLGLNGLQSRGDLIAVGTLLAFVGVSWLGVSVFQGDSLHSRVRFLADRGVSPRTTWFTRQIGPIVTLSVMSLIGLVAIGLLAYQSKTNLAAAALMLLFILQFVVVIYSVSQWMSQLFSSPIVAAIAAPAVSLLALGFLGTAVEAFGPPWWLLGVVVLLPLLATFFATRRWMERRGGARHWLLHGATATAFVLLPLLPFAYTVATTEGMSPAARSELMAEAKQEPAPQSQPQELVVTVRPSDSAQTIESGAIASAQLEAIDISQRGRAVLDSLDSQLERSDGPVQDSGRVLTFVASEMILQRSKLERGSEDDDGSQYYGELVRFCIEVTTRLRDSGRLVDQDSADRFEILLLSELKRFEGKKWIPQALFGEAAQMLANQSSRTAARKRAIAQSWFHFERSRSFKYAHSSVGGYSIPTSGSVNARELAVRRRRVQRMLETLWQFAQSDPKDTEVARRQLAEFWEVTPARYGLGEAGEFYRANDLEQWLLFSHLYTGTPGTQWLADWELDAKSLTN